MQETIITLAVLWAAGEVAGIMIALDAVDKGRTPEGSLAWAISLIFLPPVAIPLYVVFGARKFHGYVQARRSNVPAISGIREAVGKEIDDSGARVASADVHPIFTDLRHLAVLPPTTSNRTTLLIDGHDTFASIFDAIETAKKYILVQYYLIRQDHTGNRLKNRLCRKAAEGVSIYVLFDDIGSYGIRLGYIDDMRKAGIAIYGFNANRRRRNRFHLNFRNHRKLVVVDGKVGFVGGLNVGDEYLGKHAKYGPWRDTHARIEGPVVLSLQLAFFEDWFWATGEIPEFTWTVSRPTDGNDNQQAMVIASGPADRLETCSLFFMNAINAAKKRLWIATPYFTPDRAIVSALHSAALRGVDVRIMLPFRGDLRLVHLASWAYIEEVGKAGIDFYRYRAGFLHQKVMLVDDALSMVGTPNWDNRSMRINFEICLLAAGARTAAEIRDMLDRDFSRSQKISPAEFLSNQPTWFRLIVRTIRLLSPVL